MRPFLVSQVKEKLRGRRFERVEEINLELPREYVALSKRGSSDGIDGLVKRWKTRLQNDGLYFE